MIAFDTAQTLAGTRHGFFGRHGGVSTGDFSGLNVSVSVGDDPAAVAKNRARIATVLGGTALVTVKQVHSTRVVTVGATGLPDPAIEADALVTNQPNILLGVLTADCAPLLFCDPEAGVIGAAHAGWKGAVGGILTNTVSAMEALGADRSRIRVVIGPTISQKNYEVGEDFRTDVLNQNANAHFAFATPTGGKPHFDLPAYLVAEARAVGLSEVTNTALCTYADPTRYFSHRRATHEVTRTGRQIAVIGLP